MSTSSARFRFVAAITRMSILIGTLEPMRSNSRSWRMRSSLVWVPSVISPISSRKMVPLLAVSKRPLRIVMAPVNEPFSWPNSSVSSSVSGSAAQLTLISGCGLRLLARCSASATSSLPVPDSPVMRTVASDGATLPMSLKTSSIGLRRADDALALGRALAELQAKGADLRAHVGVLEDAPQGGEQVVDVERLGDVVVGAVLHRLDGGRGAAEGGHHDDLELGVLALQLAEDADPVLVGQLDIHHHEVGQVLGDLLDAPRRRSCRADRVALFVQEVGEQGADIGFVIDDEHGPLRIGQS